MDRIDLQVEIMPVPFEELSSLQPGEPSEAIRRRVIAARQIQTQRFAAEKGIHCNAQMTPRLQEKYCRLDEAGTAALSNAMNRFNMSARAYDRILKVARTIADLDDSAEIRSHHVKEAISYRNLDRATWGQF